VQLSILTQKQVRSVQADLSYSSLLHVPRIIKCKFGNMFFGFVPVERNTILRESASCRIVFIISPIGVVFIDVNAAIITGLNRFVHQRYAL